MEDVDERGDLDGTFLACSKVCAGVCCSGLWVGFGSPECSIGGDFGCVVAACFWVSLRFWEEIQWLARNRLVFGF